MQMEMQNYSNISAMNKTDNSHKSGDGGLGGVGWWEKLTV